MAMTTRISRQHFLSFLPAHEDSDFTKYGKKTHRDPRVNILYSPGRAIAGVCARCCGEVLSSTLCAFQLGLHHLVRGLRNSLSLIGGQNTFSSPKAAFDVCKSTHYFTIQAYIHFRFTYPRAERLLSVHHLQVFQDRA